jgi:hypothetical protein
MKRLQAGINVINKTIDVLRPGYLGYVIEGGRDLKSLKSLGGYGPTYGNIVLLLIYAQQYPIQY